MALQITPGTLVSSKREIRYNDGDPQINITETLKPICDEFFREEIFLEDEEEITVRFVPFKGIEPLSYRIERELLRRVKWQRENDRHLMLLISTNSDIISNLIRSLSAPIRPIRIERERSRNRIHFKHFPSKRVLKDYSHDLKNRAIVLLNKINVAETRSELKDLILFQLLIIAMLLKPNPRKCVLTLI